LRNFFHDFCYIKTHGADPYASAASDAARGLELMGVVPEFAHEAVSPPFELRIAGVVAARVGSKMVELAGVPVFSPLAAKGRTLVCYIKAVACGTAECTGPAPKAFSRHAAPELVLIIVSVGEPRAYLFCINAFYGFR
jgi:hypothetical protein